MRTESSATGLENHSLQRAARSAERGALYCLSLTMPFLLAAPQPIIADDDWASARWGAETLALFYLIAMMQIAMAHTISSVQLNTLLTVGADLFVLLGKFGVGRHRLRSLGYSEFVLCYFLAWNARDVFARFTFTDFWGVASGLCLGLGIFGAVQSGERHHGLTKRNMRTAPHDKYRWQRHGVQEDLRVFAANRVKPDRNYYELWLEKLNNSRSILGSRKDRGCSGCARQVEQCIECPYDDLMPHEVKDGEKELRLIPPLCRACWLRLLIHRQGVRTSGDRGFVATVKRWHAAASLRTHRLLTNATAEDQNAARHADGQSADREHDDDISGSSDDAEESALVEAAAVALTTVLPQEEEEAAASTAAADAAAYDSDDEIGMMTLRG